MEKNKEKTCLGDLTRDRNNNLDIMRFIAALMVIFSHAFPISCGHSDGLAQWTDGFLSFGGIAVGVFFCTGGFLIAKSAESKKTCKKFFKARCLRIFPQLIFVVFLTALVVGPFLTTLSVKEYYTNVETWRYLLNSIFILDYQLPGVFSDNIYAFVV
ncbi:MAG: acyltransferase, partial [Lachnospiraceae bacterium]|nr:acyltransferase [Lachnospiraceae bacterium]